jgi:hypothetical protein
MMPSAERPNHFPFGGLVRSFLFALPPTPVLQPCSLTSPSTVRVRRLVMLLQTTLRKGRPPAHISCPCSAVLCPLNERLHWLSDQ